MKRKLLSLLLCILLLTSLVLPAVHAASQDTYDANTIYYAGDTVIYDGITYTAKWWTRGTAPGGANSPWERAVEYDANGIAIWHEGMVCMGGTQVSYQGMIYSAKWWTTSVPGSDASWETNGGQTDEPEIPDVPEVPDVPEIPDVPEEPVDASAWDAAKIYFQGDVVIYNGISYTSKWWNRGEEPGSSAAWERETETDENGIPVWYEGMVCVEGTQVIYEGTVHTARWWTTSVPGSDASWGAIGEQENPGENPPYNPGTGPDGLIQAYQDYTVDEALVSNGDNNFKTVGYFPFYSDYWADNIQWDCLTHIIYAFAFPNGQGGLQPLDRVDLIEEMISEGHENGVEVLLGVGGWAYYGDIMEYKFDANTATPELIDTFTDAIVALVEQYGFDGVDMDWEHPRAGTNSWRNYEAMMVQLREKLGSDKLLTAAVLSGVTTSGITYYDAAAHTANVLAVCDWINVMAYDCTCTLDFCQDVAAYWCGTRGMPTNKVCMGVPFYSYPGNSTYAALVQAYGDNAVYDDMEGTANYHNSVSTMQAKTAWAMEYGLGGMMIWELSQDTTNPSTSLLHAIYNTVHAQS